jgi:hypothetical protein
MLAIVLRLSTKVLESRHPAAFHQQPYRYTARAQNCKNLTALKTRGSAARGVQNVVSLARFRRFELSIGC